LVLFLLKSISSSEIAAAPRPVTARLGLYSDDGRDHPDHFLDAFARITEHFGASEAKDRNLAFFSDPRDQFARV
jgi:hypothetical protein